jgi:hypothetical protein
MRNQQATLDGMDRDSLIAYVVDRVLEHGGDQESLFADLRNKLPGEEVYFPNDDLNQGIMFALNALFVWQEIPGGADQLREIRDKHRDLAAMAPRQRRGWRAWGG